jgi:hypothetical protein
MRPSPWLLVLGILLLTACVNLRALLRAPPDHAPTSVFRMERANRGVETYSAWFGDSGGRILYFGLSPFWELWWRTGGDARADLAKPGDHLIGRFDLERQTFLPPLRVRSMGFDARSSVWDVLAHSNGRIYYTTYFEEIGSVNPDGSDARAFSGLGAGFNELYEGPDGHIYVTRYSDAPRDVERQRYGAVVVLTPDGELVREIRFERDDQRFTAPKSLAVDPISGEIWLNTDTFWVDGSILHETLRLAPDGRVLSREVAPPELHFVRFDAGGRGYFAESLNAAFRLRITLGERELAVIPLGPRNPLDFIQDIHFTARGDTLLAFWSGRVTLVRQEGSVFRSVDLLLSRPEGCVPPQGRSLLYSAVAFGERIYATLYCGASILSAPIPARASEWR